MRKHFILYLLSAALIALMPSCRQKPQYKALIVTGQSEHNWKVSSEALKQILDETGLFSSEIITAPTKGEDMSAFNPVFSNYNLVILDYEGDDWPEPVHSSLMDYVKNGGGLVIYNSKSNLDGAAYDSITVSERHDFEIRTLPGDHPVTNGLPVRWLHPGDLIVQGIKLAGDSQVLAAAFSDTAFSGSGKREPVLFARNFGKGRIFTTMIGTPSDTVNKALHCAGFIVTLQRGAEWASTGKVTQEVPYDFPNAAATVVRPDFKCITPDEIFEFIGSYDISKSTKYFTLLQSEIRKAAGDEKKLLKLEKKMVGVLKSKESTNDSKKLILRELSWMGTDYCIPAIKDLSSNPELNDDVEFALNRLQDTN
jgi:uncharacterized protein